MKQAGGAVGGESRQRGEKPHRRKGVASGMETPASSLLIVEKRTPNATALKGEEPQEWIYAGNA